MSDKRLEQLTVSLQHHERKAST